MESCHSLNYLFTHLIDLKRAISMCQACSRNKSKIVIKRDNVPALRVSTIEKQGPNNYNMKLQHGNFWK